MSPDLACFFGQVNSGLDKISSEDSVLHFPLEFRDFPETVECHKVFNGIEESLEVRSNVISDYLTLTSEIGLVKKNSRTFRNALHIDGLSESLWWYHKVSCRDNKTSPEFDEMVQLYTINRVYAKSGCTDIFFHSTPFRMAKVLKDRWPHFQYTFRGSRESLLKALAKGVGSRIFYFINSAKKIVITSRFKKSPNQKFHIIFFGFWDWSVNQDKNGDLVDKYYKFTTVLKLTRNYKTGLVGTI